MNIGITMPKLLVKVRRSRTVISRMARSVSLNGPRGLRSTLEVDNSANPPHLVVESEQPIGVERRNQHGGNGFGGASDANDAVALDLGS